jgi:hypothetical protein
MGAVVNDDRLVVNVGYISDVNIGHAPVVIEAVSAPVAAVETVAGVAIAVIDAAIEADVRSPVTIVPSIKTVIPAPIAWRPKHSDGSLHPSAGDPIIAVVVIPRPITRCPDITLTRANRLNVNWQRRGADPD